jgi:PAS domain S-box-containing protein
MNKPSTTEPTVLIVEDEAIVAEDLSRKVKALGYRVVGIYGTGEEAIEAAQASCTDLVLLDLQLSGKLDGVQTAERLHHVCEAAVVFISANSDPETVKKANATAPYGYILKPFGDRDLAVQLAIALHKHHADNILLKNEEQLRQANAQLVQTQEILLAAQRGAKAGVWEIDLQTRNITWSAPYYELFGIDPALQPSPDVWISCVHPEDRARISEQHERSLKEQRNQDMVFRIVKPDGSTRWIQRTGKMEFNEHGEAIRINGISFDITERKQAEDAVSAVALFPAQNPSPVLRVNRAGILLYMNPASEKLLKRLGLEVGQPVQAFLRDLVDHSLTTARSEISEQTSGSRLYLVSVTPINNENYANLYWTDITELRASERLMRAIFNQQFAFSAVLSPEGQIVQLSESVYRNNEGTTSHPSDLIGRNFLEAPWWRDLPDTVAEWRRQFSEAVSQPGPARGEAPYRLADGELRYAMNTVTALRGHDGNVEYLLCEGMDITARRRAEIALRESEESYRATFDNAGVGIAHVGLDGRWIRFNDAVCQITGYSREELLTKTFADITHPDDIEPDWENAGRLLAGEISTYSVEKRYFRKDGALVWVNLTVSLLQSESGAARHFISVIQDITNRKRAESIVRERERFLTTVTGAARVGLVVVGPGYVYQFANEAYAEIFGLPTHKIIGRHVYDILPAGWSQIQPRLDRAFAGQRVSYELTLPPRGQTGNSRLYSVSYEPHEDEEHLKTVVVVVVDISRKHGKEKLEQSLERTDI